MREIESPIEAYLRAGHNLVEALDAAGGSVPLPNGRIVTVGRAEFDAHLGERRKRAWVIVRKQAPMPARRVTARILCTRRHWDQKASKMWMGTTHFLMKTLPNVATETALHCDRLRPHAHDEHRRHQTDPRGDPA
jgi:hypothetical protein